MPVHVELSKRLHYKPSRAMLRADLNDEQCACIPANTTVTVQYGHTGRVLLVAETAEEMRDYQLKDCAVSAVAVAADIPRILVQLLWRPAGIRSFTASFIPALSTAWLGQADDNYDYRFDHSSEKLHDVLPIMGSGRCPCISCGDETDDADESGSPIHGRMGLCRRCRQTAMCEACRCEINGNPVCLMCVTAEEIPLIPERAHRRFSTFWSADPEHPARTIYFR